MMSTPGTIKRHLTDFFAFSREFGAWIAIQWLFTLALSKLGLRRHKTIRIKPTSVLHPLRARIWGASDMDAVKLIFLGQEYSPLQSIKDVTGILDLGANAGYSSAYFLNCFSSSHVLAVEPDKSNFDLCQKNLQPYGDRVRVLHGAAWSECTQLSFGTDVFGDGKEWSVHVTRPADGKGGEVEAWDVATLIRMTGERIVDILKIDIEGAEIELFKAGAQRWLPYVRNLCIELHGPECMRSFNDAMSAFEYEQDIIGELTICRNIRPKR